MRNWNVLVGTGASGDLTVVVEQPASNRPLITHPNRNVRIVISPRLPEQHLPITA